ncbi:MAG: 50S ribosomal protein L25 [Melioribacteraceae bacterium]|nr:50S ribosomal protein L25 [Melioribacteraceae bacterium]
MSELNLIAEPRTVSTKGAVNKLRKDGKIPGVLYSKEMEPVIFSVTEIALKPVIYTTEMNLINLKIGDKDEVKSIVKDVQFDPLTDRIVHVDFQAITVGQLIQVQVPLNLTGQSVGIKAGGRLVQNIHKVDVECLPKNIPSHLDVDITELNVGDSVLVKDLEFENISILNSGDTSIVSIAAARTEEVEAEASEEVLEETESAEPEVIGKGKSEEESEG